METMLIFIVGIAATLGLWYLLKREKDRDEAAYRTWRKRVQERKEST